MYSLSHLSGLKWPQLFDLVSESELVSESSLISESDLMSESSVVCESDLVSQFGLICRIKPGLRASS